MNAENCFDDFLLFISNTIIHIKYIPHFPSVFVVVVVFRMRMKLALQGCGSGRGWIDIVLLRVFFVNASKLATQGCPQDPDVVHKLFISDEYI